MERKYYIICLVFGTWTFIQTSLHVVGVIYAYFWSICEQSPTDAETIFVYLTYLYNSGCAKPKLQNITLSPPPFQSYVLTIVSDMFTETSSNTTNLEEIVGHLLEKIDCFPENATPLTRTSVFLLVFIILDGTWMVSAVSLIMGTIFGIKETLSLAFFGPWLVMTVCVCIADAVATVVFGFDITETVTFDGWMSFVGIPDSSCFPPRNETDVLFVIPSLVFCSISSRFILIWISNWIGFILVMKATISVYHETYKNEFQNGQRQRNFTNSVHHQRSRTGLNTSADRIRNWQLFYGAIDTTTSDNNVSSNSLEEVRAECSSVNSEDASGAYHAYPNVTESVVVAEPGGRCIEELRGQLPWSYIQPQDDGRGEEKIELENRAKRHLRIKSDSSGSGTEL